MIPHSRDAGGSHDTESVVSARHPGGAPSSGRHHALARLFAVLIDVARPTTAPSSPSPPDPESADDGGGDEAA